MAKWDLDNSGTTSLSELVLMYATADEFEPIFNDGEGGIMEEVRSHLRNEADRIAVVETAAVRVVSELKALFVESDTSNDGVLDTTEIAGLLQKRYECLIIHLLGHVHDVTHSLGSFFPVPSLV